MLLSHLGNRRLAGGLRDPEAGAEVFAGRERGRASAGATITQIGLEERGGADAVPAAC